ncbi:alcohol dehydrogenase catalytic domain-containing protein [Geodermatophilus sp. YIM 151500]|uniref:alcohol dehydrogenase catalytic domain-containing protein n=1 Tax=Geodermatophilus sp. YIM 151500 TaxID=2984531 RepID=UPI0021E3B8DC|nr:alcohol dehydrogenase catalytic domain-containing protein [Geodermatophilus sp. YIM 151500]MCV2488198.1 alcohol dehydrogenase catalytic domain-containing protein [Geodermatophilus sp. YIM 151500]
MKQAVLHAPLDLKVEDADVPALESGDVLLRVESALVCGTDVRIFEGRKKRNVTYPTVMGHEFSATVVDSAGVLPDGVSEGALVCVYPLLPCGECVACTRDHPNICRNRVAFGYQLAGGFSQYVRVPAAAVRAGNLVPVGTASPGAGALVEPLACAYNGQRLASAAGAPSMLVSGCGPLGLMHIRLARQLGVQRIAAVDPIEQRRAAAATSGAELTLAPGEDAARQVLDWTGGAGVDVLVMAVGRTDALHPYLGVLAPGARVSVFAGFSGEGTALEIPANDIHYNEWTVVGASSCRLDDFQQVAGLVRSGALQVDDLVGAQLPIDEAVGAIELAASGRDMRVGIAPWA